MRSSARAVPIIPDDGIGTPILSAQCVGGADMYMGYVKDVSVKLKNVCASSEMINCQSDPR